MQSEEEIKTLREKLHQKFANLENIQIEENTRKLPLRERMNKNKKIYEQVLSIQKDAFFNEIYGSIKRWNLPVNEKERKDLFDDFWTEFMTLEVNSLYQFLLNRGYKKKENTNI